MKPVYYLLILAWALVGCSNALAPLPSPTPPEHCPKESISTKRYQNASISKMVICCNKGALDGLCAANSRQPVSGTGDVLVYSYSMYDPCEGVDANYNYDLYLQFNPDLIKRGQELLIPAEGVETYVIAGSVPGKPFCDSNLQGRITILEVTEDNIKTLLVLDYPRINLTIDFK
jgi:hypothetical protein